MKIFSKAKMVILASIFISSIFVFMDARLCPADEAFINQLKDTTEQYLKGEHFPELLDYLNIARVDKTDPEDIFFVDYYLAIAKSAYLNYLEKKEDWSSFYDQLYDFDMEIIESVQNYVQQRALSAEIVDLQYLAWNAYLREDDRDGSREAVDKLIKLVINFTEQEKSIVKFLDIAQKISDKGDIRQLNKLFTSYKDHLFENNSDASSIEMLVKIADDYLEKDRVETAEIIYQQYLKLILMKYSQAESQLALLNICEKFRHHGFYKGVDADFAEEIYALLEEKQGSNVLSEADCFARAFNLQIMSEYERANEEYRGFVKTFKQSKFLPEVYTRLAIINLYALQQVDAAGLFFDKVINEFPESDYAQFCTYERARLWQWQQEFDKASQLYERLVKKQADYSDLSVVRLKEIAQGINTVDQKYAFPLQQDMIEASPIEMTLDAFPDRVFTGETVSFKATAQDFSSGTIQPMFNYGWFGDLGGDKIPDNTTEFSTQFNRSYPEVIGFKASVGDSENSIYRDVWVHKIKISLPAENSKIKTGENVEFKAAVIPASIEDKYFSWQWQIQGEENLVNESQNFTHKFEKPGIYEVEVMVNIKGVKLSKQLSFEVIE